MTASSEADICFDQVDLMLLTCSWGLSSKQPQHPSFSPAKSSGDFYTGLNQFLRARISLPKLAALPSSEGSWIKGLFFPLKDG